MSDIRVAIFSAEVLVCTREITLALLEMLLSQFDFRSSCLWGECKKKLTYTTTATQLLSKLATIEKLTDNDPLSLLRGAQIDPLFSCKCAGDWRSLYLEIWKYGVSFLSGIADIIFYRIRREDSNLTLSFQTSYDQQHFLSFSYYTAKDYLKLLIVGKEIHWIRPWLSSIFFIWILQILFSHLIEISSKLMLMIVSPLTGWYRGVFFL